MTSLRYFATFLLLLFSVLCIPVKTVNYLKVKSVECKSSEISKEYFYPNISYYFTTHRKSISFNFYINFRKEIRKIYVSFFLRTKKFFKQI